MKNILLKYLGPLCLVFVAGSAVSMFLVVAKDIKEHNKIFAEKLQNSTCNRITMKIGEEDIVQKGSFLVICKEK